MATKQQFLNGLLAYEPVDCVIDGFVGTEKFDHENEAGDKFYYINVRKVKNNLSVNYENIMFVVIDEGLPEERCYAYKISDIVFDNKQEQGNLS